MKDDTVIHVPGTAWREENIIANFATVCWKVTLEKKHVPIAMDAMTSTPKLIPYPHTNDNPARTDPCFLIELQQPDNSDIAAKRFTELSNLLYESSLSSFETLVHNADGESYVDQQDSGGQTLLHLAAFWGRPDAVALLIDLGANIDLNNIEGRRPIDVAIDWEQEECAELLRSAGGRSSLEETIKSLETKNMALLRSLDLERRKLKLTSKNLKVSQRNCFLITQERDESIFASQCNLQRAEIAEKGTATLIEKLEAMTRVKETWEKKCHAHVKSIGIYRAKICQLAQTLKKTLLEKHAFL